MVCFIYLRRMSNLLQKGCRNTQQTQGTSKYMRYSSYICQRQLQNACPSDSSFMEQDYPEFRTNCILRLKPNHSSNFLASEHIYVHYTHKSKHLPAHTEAKGKIPVNIPLNNIFRTALCKTGSLDISYIQHSESLVTPKMHYIILMHMENKITCCRDLEV